MSKLSKNTKILIFSGLGILVLAAVLLLLILTEKPPEEPEEEMSEDTSYLTLSSYTAADIKSVEVKNEKDIYTIISPEENVFEIPELLNAPRNESKYTNTTNYLSGLTARHRIEENAEDLAKYGLINPTGYALVTFNDGTDFEVFVGDDVPTSDNLTYVRVRDSSDVFAVSTFMVSFLRENRCLYVSTTLSDDYETAGSPTVEFMTIDVTEKDRFSIQSLPPYKEGEVVTSYNTHKLTEPVEIELNYTQSQEVLYGMYGLSALEASKVDANGFEEAGTGDFKDNGNTLAVIEMTAEGKKSSLTIGLPVYTEQTADDGSVYDVLKGYYGVYSEYPEVLYIFSPDTVNVWLNVTVESIMSRMFLIPYIYNLSEFTVETPAKTLNFSIKGDDNETEEFFIDGEPIDASRFKSFYQFCISSYADSLYDGETEGMELLARFTYKYRNGTTSDDVVELFDSGDRKCVISVNGKPQFVTRMLYITRLEQNIELLLNGGKIITDW